MVVSSFLIFSFLFVICLFVISYLFLSHHASPIPYFPSNKHDLPLIIAALKLKNGQTIIDCGAGDGAIIFPAAQAAYKQKLTTKFVAIEINPILIAILYIRRLFHPNKNNISICRADLFTTQFTQHNPTFFFYISPWYLEKALANIKKQRIISPIVSYFYPLPHRSPTKTTKGIHSVYSYA